MGSAAECGIGVATHKSVYYHGCGSGCRLVAVPAFKAVRGAIALSPVGSIPTPSALLGKRVPFAETQATPCRRAQR